MSLRTWIRQRAVALLPTRSDLAFRVARRIVNDHNGDNNSDIATNGELRLARLALPSCANAFDVGANIGEWTQLALAINPSLVVHAFEPSPTTFRTLNARTFPPSVTINNIALGSRVEDRDLYIFEDNSGTNSLHARSGVGASITKRERIHVETLDAYASAHGIDRIGFVKIDTEGHELAVLQGARGMIAAGAIAILQFEYGGSYIDARTLLKDVWELVVGVNRDYAVFKIFPERLERLDEYRQVVETYQYSNWAIIHVSVKGIV
jgi:FkbM family methyltransferase